MKSGYPKGSRFFKKGTHMILEEIKLNHKLGSLSKDLSIKVYKKIDSTNTRAKLFAESKSNTNAIFIAKEQTAGRGRLGRTFVSTKGNGLYLSILLNKKLPPEFATALTTYMAVIASRAIHTVAGVQPKIKWVNDLYLSGKKLAGILTEGKASENGESLDYAVVGIGVNLLKQDFPDNVKTIATTLENECQKQIDPIELAAHIISDFFENLSLVGTPELAEEYRHRSFLIGERVNVIKPTSTYSATVNGITDKCELMLTLEDGTKEILSTGEVSVRIANS